jgi:DNA processing protein
LEKNLLRQQIALTLLQGIGPVKARHLLSKVSDLSAVFESPLRELSHQTKFTLTSLKKMNRDFALEQAEKYLSYLINNEIQTCFITDPKYPRRLKQCADAPLLLYARGNMDLNPPKSLAIVGTRKATEYGKMVCEDFLQKVAGKNITVVSGMAYGIDICAHQLCLKYDIPTIGVLGHGLDKIYPSQHKSTALKMLNNGGLLTEFLPFTNPDRENFPMRNRIVAGMCDATLVIESKDRGGSLITADLANDYSRDVFAVPGNLGQIYSQGCNRLIQSSKAHLYLGPEHFLKWMDWGEETASKSIQVPLFVDLNPEEQVMVDILKTEGEQHMDVLSMKSKLPISQTSVVLFHLELNGVVRVLPGKKYVLIT